MGFLDKLWDETLAGPTPEKGLGRFRKYNSFSAVRSSNHPMVKAASGYDHNDDETVTVTRSITILRPKSLSVDHGSASGSDSGSSTPSSGPSSPYSPETRRDPDVKRFSRKKPGLDPMMDPTAAAAASTSPSCPTVYDWIMIGALDR